MTFRHTTDVARAAWIREALTPWPRGTGERMTLASLVPRGYPRLVAVPNDPAIPWALAEVEDRPEGTLDIERWRVLAGILEQVHGVDAPVTAGLWTGYGWIAAPGARSTGVAMAWVMVPTSGSRLVTGVRRARARVARAWYRNPARDAARQRAQGSISSFDVDVESLPLLELENREYALFRGTTTTLRTPGWPRASGWAWMWEGTVDLCWPDDRSWFASSDTDLTQLYLACDDRLAEAVLSAELGATEVDLADAPR